MSKKKVLNILLYLYGSIFIFAFVLRGVLNPLIPLILYGWILTVIYFFRKYPPQRVLIVAFIVATLFLPEYSLSIRANLAITKTTATALGAFLATLIFYPNRLLALRPGWCDLPMLIWMIGTIPSQILNGLSPITPVIQHWLVWGAPYLLGRIFIRTLEDLKQLAIAIFLSGVLYAPLCLVENLKTPNLHLWVYGFAARSSGYEQTFRWGGYRPTVFMEHGLAVGMWMMAATLIAIWLWQTKAIPKKLWSYPTKLIVFWLIFAFIQTRSTGAYLYCLVGFLTFIFAKWFRTALPIFLVALISTSYVSLGAVGKLYEIPQVRAFMDQEVQEENEIDARQGSFRFRMRNEEVLSEHARKRFVFGWGGSGRNRVFDEEGRDITVTDSIWIIEFGTRGILGLAGFFLSFILPAIGLIWRYPPRTWQLPKVAAAASLATVLILYTWDSALNAFPNPVYIVASGGLATVAMKSREALDDRRSRSAVPQNRLLPMRAYRN